MKFLIKQFQELMKFLEGGEIMSEFKAQLLGILIVIGVFSAIVVGYKTLVDNTWDKIDHNSIFYKTSLINFTKEVFLWKTMIKSINVFMKEKKLNRTNQSKKKKIRNQKVKKNVHSKLLIAFSD